MAGDDSAPFSGFSLTGNGNPRKGTELSTNRSAEALEQSCDLSRSPLFLKKAGSVLVSALNMDEHTYGFTSEKWLVKRP